MITLAFEEVYVDFKKIYRHRPATYKLSPFYSVLCKVARVSGWMLLLLGGILVMASAFNDVIFTGLRNDPALFPGGSNSHSDYLILVFQAVMGGFFLVIGLAIFAVKELCSMILRRNEYINQLEELYLKMNMELDETDR